MHAKLLAPNFIGILAGYIKEAITENPLPPIERDGAGVIIDQPIKGDGEQMEPWEVQLKRTVDLEPRLPSYDGLLKDGHSVLVETLIEYYTPELMPEVGSRHDVDEDRGA